MAEPHLAVWVRQPGRADDSTVSFDVAVLSQVGAMVVTLW